MSSSSVAIPTSLKLPAGLKAQLEEIAQKAGMSLHAFMLQTLDESVQRARLRESFAQDSRDALSEMRVSGMGYELADVRSHFSELAQFRKGLRSRPPALHAKPVG
jgi:hypothetical protein